MTGIGGGTFVSSCTVEETHGSQGCQIMIMIDFKKNILYLIINWVLNLNILGYILLGF